MNFSGSNSTTGLAPGDLKNSVLRNVIIFVLCVSINSINATLVYTFSKHKILNMNPRYILYIHLVINDIILLTLLTLFHIVSAAVFTINVSLCMILILIGVASNLSNPVTLAIMAIECYVAVCFPLRHAQICTVKKTYIAIGIIWLISALYILPDVFFALLEEPLDFYHSRIFCTKPTVFRHPKVAEKDTIFDALLMALVWLTLFYSYVRIVFTAKSASANARKARNTVLLHSFQLMLSMLNYLYLFIYNGLLTLFPESVHAVRFAVTIFINVMPRLVSPLVYGLRDNTFKKYLKQHLVCVKLNNS